MKLMMKIFLLGVILQFFLQTFVTFILKIDNSAIWLWKEIFILIFMGYVGYKISKNKDYNIIKKDKYIYRILIIFIIQVILGLLFSFFTGAGISRFVLAFKYDFLGYAIFFIFYFMAFYLKEDLIANIVKWFGKVIVWLLVLALFWYSLILVKPGGLKFFGYSPVSNEGKIGERPPAVYKTQQYYGYPRNQFLFERPISWGFFLIAFWPLFFMLYLRKKNLKNVYGRRMLYGANVILTFSRGAWIAFFLQIILIGILVYRKEVKKYLLKTILPLVLVMLLFAIFGYRQIVQREFSNTGHIDLLKKGLTMVGESPIFGKGAGYVGPASYWGGIGFNPENQYLQIMIEFGVIVFVLWFIIFMYLNLYPLFLYTKSDKKLNKHMEFGYLIAMAVGMLGLAFQGLFLHSFVDRMIVYPFMLMYGLILGNYIRLKNKN